MREAPCRHAGSSRVESISVGTRLVRNRPDWQRLGEIGATECASRFSRCGCGWSRPGYAEAASRDGVTNPRSIGDGAPHSASAHLGALRHSLATAVTRSRPGTKPVCCEGALAMTVGTASCTSAVDQASGNRELSSRAPMPSDARTRQCPRVARACLRLHAHNSSHQGEQCMLQIVPKAVA